MLLVDHCIIPWELMQRSIMHFSPENLHKIYPASHDPSLASGISALYRVRVVHKLTILHIMFDCNSLFSSSSLPHYLHIRDHILRDIEFVDTPPALMAGNIIGSIDLVNIIRHTHVRKKSCHILIQTQRERL